jgi:hypothetical protein
VPDLFEKLGELWPWRESVSYEVRAVEERRGIESLRWPGKTLFAKAQRGMTVV